MSEDNNSSYKDTMPGYSELNIAKVRLMEAHNRNQTGENEVMNYLYTTPPDVRDTVLNKLREMKYYESIKADVQDLINRYTVSPYPSNPSHKILQKTPEYYQEAFDIVLSSVRTMEDLIDRELAKAGILFPRGGAKETGRFSLAEESATSQEE